MAQRVVYADSTDGSDDDLERSGVRVRGIDDSHESALPLQILKQWDLNVRENKLVATDFNEPFSSPPRAQRGLQRQS